MTTKLWLEGIFDESELQLMSEPEVVKDVSSGKLEVLEKYQRIGFVVLCRDYVQCDDSKCPFRHYWNLPFITRWHRRFSRFYESEAKVHGSVEDFEMVVLKRACKRFGSKSTIGFNWMNEPIG